MNKVFVFVRGGNIINVLHSTGIDVYIIDEDVKNKENCISKYESSYLEEELPSLNNIEKNFYDKKVFNLYRNYLIEEFNFIGGEGMELKKK